MSSTEDVALNLIASIDSSPFLEATTEPDDDLRSGGTYFDIEDDDGEEFTVIVVTRR